MKALSCGPKYKRFREFRTPFPFRDIRENPRNNVRACAAGDGAICSKNRKIIHGANLNTKNGARLRSPSLIMAPDHAQCHVTRNRKCILPEWLKPFFRIFCTMTIQKPFPRNLSMRFGLWWKIKKWERKMCFFDHSFVHIFFVFHFVAKPMLEFRENMMFFRTVLKSSNYNYLSKRKVLFSRHRK